MPGQEKQDIAGYALELFRWRESTIRKKLLRH